MAPAVELATGYVSLAVSTRGLGKGVAREFAGIERQADATGKRSGKRLGVGLAGALKAGGLVTGVAGIVKGFGAAVGSAGKFEKSMRLVGVTTKVGSGELKSLTQTAIEMGAKTSFSAQGASDAMVSLAKGGLKAAEIQGGALEQTLTLATAGGLELGDAADYMVSGLRAFGLEAKDSGRVAAALAGGANASTASVESMGLALAQVAAQANTAGLSIEDTTAGIAALANNGIQGSDAGTSLKVMLQRLVPQTDKAKGSMEELGLITKDGSNQFFDAQGNMKSLTQVAGLLQTALKDQTKEQKINTLYRLFGSDATRAASILTKEGAAGLAEYTKATSDQNAAQSLAANATQGFAGAMERFKGSVETVGIQLGTLLLPYLTKLLNFVSGTAIPGMTAFAGVLSKHRDLIGALAAGIGAVAGPILLMIGAFKVAALVARAWAAAQVLLNIALTANPIGLVVIALAGLVAGLVYAWKHSETFRNVVLSVWGAVKTAVLAVVNWLVTNVPAAWHKITTAVSTVVSVVASVLKKAFNLWTLPLRLVMAAILTLMVLGWMAIRKPVIAAFNFIKDRIIVPVWRAIINRFQTSMSIIRSAWTRFWSLVRSGASIMWNFVYRNIILPVWNRIRAVWTSASTAVRGTWTRFWNAIKTTASTVFNLVKKTISSVLTQIRDRFRSGVDAIGKAWDKLKAKAASPIRFVIKTVLNDGLIAAFNTIAHALKLDRLPDVKVPKAFAAASGGVLPGYTPGRDVHRFYSPTGGIMDLSGGEGIARPEIVRAVGKKRWDRMNREAAHGRISRAAGYLGGFFLGGTAPVSGSARRHRGYPWARWAGDFSAGMGTPVHAWNPGTVAAVKYWNYSYGRHVRVNHPGNQQTLYAHLQRAIVRVGQSVRQNQVLGYSDSTGNSTGPHLHFELKGGHGVLGGKNGSGAVQAVVDYVAKLKDKFKGPLAKLAGLGKNPWVMMLRKAGTKLADGMIEKVKKAMATLTTSGAFTSAGGGSNRAIGRRMMLQRWAASQWPALNSLWTRESGWRTTARNPSSGAYGIPQSLPASKMASAGADWRTNPATQVEWGLGYIASRYGSPSKAWAHSQRTGWYDKGGILEPGWTLAYNGTGKQERVVPPGSSADGGITINGGVHGYSAEDVAEAILKRQRRERALRPVFAA